MNKPEVYKVIGAPGTGKTTRVVGNPELDLRGLFLEEMDNGYSLNDQMLVTYTNSGVDEAADRLEKMLDRPRSHIDARVTTIHSQCFGTLNLNRDQVANSYEERQFCDNHDLAYGWDDDDDDIMAGADDADEGNVLMQIYGWLQSNCKPLSEWQDCPANWPGDKDPEFLMQKWETYKQENGLLDFSDMITRVVENGLAQVKQQGWVDGEVNKFNAVEKLNEAREYMFRTPMKLRGEGSFIDSKVLYVDEVQDLTPLQWRWYLLQKLVCDKVYLGGDDDQSIYGWAGADPEFMLGEEGDFEVLESTYRIPSEVWKACNNVITQVDERQQKEVQPDREGGEVVELKNPRAQEVAEHLVEADGAFALFRARYMIDEFREDLHRLGIPYRNDSTFDTWSEEVELIRDGLYKVKEDEGPLNHEEYQAMKENVPNKVVTESGIEGDGFGGAFEKWNGVPVDKVKESFDLTKSDKRVAAALNPRTYLKVAENNRYESGGGELNYYECEALKGNLTRGKEHLTPDDIVLGTIHSSKGRERETVVVCTDTTKTIAENMESELADQPNKHVSDSERRVYYVGMSRSSNKLVLAEGLVNSDTVIPIETLLHGKADGPKQTRLND